MNRQAMPCRLSVDPVIDLPAGAIVLRDEGTRTDWSIEVAAFWLAPTPVTRELHTTVLDTAPPSSAGPQTPTTEVSWLDAV